MTGDGESRLPSYISEHWVLFVIFINTTSIFLVSFPHIHAQYGMFLYAVDYICTIYFIFEVGLKVRTLGWGSYYGSIWNKFDFWVITLSAPALLEPITHVGFFSFFTLLRIIRLMRFFLILRFLPDIDHLLVGLKRSIKACVGIFLALMIYIFVLSMGAFYLFSEAAPNHFGDPIVSLYSMFKVFTIEGWFTIPDTIAASSGVWLGGIARIYFVFSVLTGGIIGLSIANAIFVDQMVMDNTDELERKVDDVMVQIKDILAEEREHRNEVAELLNQVKECIPNLPKNEPYDGKE